MRAERRWLAPDSGLHSLFCSPSLSHAFPCSIPVPSLFLSRPHHIPKPHHLLSPLLQPVPLPGTLLTWITPMVPWLIPHILVPSLQSVLSEAHPDYPSSCVLYASFQALSIVLLRSTFTFSWSSLLVFVHFPHL